MGDALTILLTEQLNSSKTAAAKTQKTGGFGDPATRPERQNLENIRRGEYEKIKEEIRLNEALLSARRAAAEFGNELMSQPEPNQVATLEKLAAAKSRAVLVTKPFDRSTGLTEFEDEIVGGRAASEDSTPETVRDLIREKAFSLTDERTVLFNAIPGKRAIYIIARKGKVPSEMQPLDKIKDKVTTDYKTFMALDLARKAGQAFQAAATNGLAAKKSFAEICAAEKVKLIDIPPISAATRSLTNVDERVSLRLLQGAALDMEVGKASQFMSVQPPTEGGFVLYVKSRPPVVNPPSTGLALMNY